MGISIIHYLVPADRDRRPTVEQLSAFFKALANDRWIIYPQTSEFNGVPLNVPEGVEESGIEYTLDGCNWNEAPYPISPTWLDEMVKREIHLVLAANYLPECRVRNTFSDSYDNFDEYGYTLNIQLANDYIYHWGEYIGRLPKTQCSCGHELYYEIESKRPIFGHTRRIKYQCPNCHAIFDPSPMPAPSREPQTGDDIKIFGGGAYRFALVFDLDRGVHPYKLQSDFVRLCQRIFDFNFVQMTDIS